MKKRTVTKLLAAVISILILAGMLCCCTKTLNGTYVSEELIPQTLTFEKNGIVTISAFGIDANGTYVIENDKMTMTYTILGISFDLEKTFSRDGSDIVLDGVKFIKK